jgi:CspA family cold shock protein
MLCSRQLRPQGAFWLMFLYSSLNSPNDPVAGVAFGPSGTAAIGCGKEPSGRQSNNLFLHLCKKAEFSNLMLKAKGVAFVKEKGTVKWFNGAKGYGFIQRSTGEDVFVHFSAIQENGYRTLNEGETVEYELMKGPKGFLAANVLRGSAN